MSEAKHIILGISGGIAAYKSLELIRLFRKQGALVQVIFTENAPQFVTSISVQALSGRPPRTHLFDESAEAAMSHIELAKWADTIVIAPASANVIAKLAHGFSDDLLTTVCLASDAKRYVAPAMNQRMWSKPETQSNVSLLKKNGALILEPESGLQACGDDGVGRMMEALSIFNSVMTSEKNSDVSVLITAGGTQEAIDPVRYVTNYSSGKMGYELARAFQTRGARVTLITAPTHLSVPSGVKSIHVKTALEMHDAVQSEIQHHSVLIGSAAVSDYRPSLFFPEKMHKTAEKINLELIQNPDIVAMAKQKKPSLFVAAFAAETEHVLTNARAKKERKKADVMIANQVGDGIGFNADENEVWAISETDEVYFPKQPKSILAHHLADLILREYRKKEQHHVS